MQNTSLKYQVLALAIMTAIASPASSAAKSNNPADENAPAVSGEFIIQFLPTATEAEKTRALKKIKGVVVETVLSKEARKDKDGRGDLMVIQYQPDFSPAAAKREIESDPAVEFVEPNYIYTHQATISNDPYYSLLWGMQSVNSVPTSVYGSQASAAWAKNQTNCSTVYIGIIDEGYMYTHEDLAANAGKNPGEIAGNKKDDDGNGYVDDVYGWDFDGNNSTVFDGVDDDHGTHVAGTIGAVGGNAKGVAGMCWQVKLLDAKFLGKLGGTLANAVKAVDYFTNLKTRSKNPVNIVATNNSWGGGGYSLALENAIGRANNAGILFVAAAGNNANNNDASASYPASYPNDNVISVAAITSTGELASFSNYGHTSVDLGAPGSNIASTIPVKSGNKVVSGYAYYSGTSMATPHVTGACALYAATHSGVTASDIKMAILGDATATDALLDKTLTGGRLDVSEF